MSEPRIFLSAGEASGDLHAAALAAALLEVFPNAELYGLAGPRMVAAGVEPIVEFDSLVVMGLAEIISRLPFFLRLRRHVQSQLAARPPDLVIPVDYPGFNLWLCERAHERGLSVLYYIAPQLWAWRPGRARILARHADRVAVVFPQEEPFLRDFGVDAVFVGHPLLDRQAGWESAREAIAALGADPNRPILGLLPGSRPQEVRRLLAPFLAVAREVVRRRPETQVVVSGAPHVPAEAYAATGSFPVYADSTRVLCASTAVLSKSGTTTVEAALIQTPLVIAHRVHPLTYRVARRLVSVDSVGMVNLLAGKRVAPEFIQSLPVRRIADVLLPLLDPESPERQKMVDSLRAVRERLGQPGAPKRVARMAKELIEARR